MIFEQCLSRKSSMPFNFKTFDLAASGIIESKFQHCLAQKKAA
ncbi:hypothetical protein LRU_01064 [Ligilactobacillus ruminis SPM0211]|uniref:Uncharacterized protein n=1 Tax=Ligilactobacillus ruminis SPM0211 TaxID=1040964 RepID=F7R0H4_9LACO|nr:hypothetical protein LRU_01064 [Ligilactobacillus ruminis SPM0211]